MHVCNLLSFRPSSNKNKCCQQEKARYASIFVRFSGHSKEENHLGKEIGPLAISKCLIVRSKNVSSFEAFQTRLRHNLMECVTLFSTFKSGCVTSS